MRTTTANPLRTRVEELWVRGQSGPAYRLDILVRPHDPGIDHTTEWGTPTSRALVHARPSITAATRRSS